MDAMNLTFPGSNVLPEVDLIRDRWIVATGTLGVRISERVAFLGYGGRRWYLLLLLGVLLLAMAINLTPPLHLPHSPLPDSRLPPLPELPTPHPPLPRQLLVFSLFDERFRFSDGGVIAQSDGITRDSGSVGVFVQSGR